VPHESNGPTELATLAIGQRRQAVAAGRTTGRISNEAYSALIGLAYSASLAREEGVFVQCQLHCPADEAREAPGTSLIRFDHDINLDGPDTIRKLAHAASLDCRALLIAERDSGLVVRGILEVRRDLQIVGVGLASLSMQAGLTGTTVAILGPGRIAVYDTFPALQLTAGRITSPIPRFMEYPFLLRVLEPIIQTVFDDRAKFTYQLPDPKDPATAVPYFVADAWQRVVARAIRGEYGGAFAIVNPALLKQIDLKYQVEPLPFGRRMVGLWETSFAPRSDQDVKLSRIYDWRNK